MPPKKIIIYQKAKADIGKIIHFIRDDKPIAATNLQIRLEKKIYSLEIFSERGKKVLELQNTPYHGTRELVVPPCRIIYKIIGDEVHIMRVLHMRQNIPFSS